MNSDSVNPAVTPEVPNPAFARKEDFTAMEIDEDTRKALDTFLHEFSERNNADIHKKLTDLILLKTQGKITSDGAFKIWLANLGISREDERELYRIFKIKDDLIN